MKRRSGNRSGRSYQAGSARLLCLFSKSKLNNQGSTLLTIIMCIALISILGSLMLSVTMTNLQMKVLESKSKKNFYSAEMVMDKIRVASQEIASEAVKDIYENEVLINYAGYLGMTESDRNDSIKRQVAALIIKTVGNTLGYSDDAAILAAAGFPIQSDYFLTKQYLTEEENNFVTWNEIRFEIVDGRYTVNMSDIIVEFEQDDYRTAIASDIVITIPNFSFKDGEEQLHYRMEQPYKDYVLVADGAITSIEDYGHSYVTGNVYAGNGISIDGKNTGMYQLSMNGDTIVTRADIRVSDTAKLFIGDSSNPLIWADNIQTYTSEYYPSGSFLTTDLNIKGISIIKDDLVIDGLNSQVKLSGAYIGYTELNNKESSEGSAIMINGSGSGLNMAGLEELILAGRAHIFVEDFALNRETNILTGESLAFKSNQRAYLLPGEFIETILHNPITQEDYVSLGSGVYPTVNIYDTPELPYTSYVDEASTPFIIAAKQTGSTVLRYYYFNFKDGKAGDQYLRDYMNRAEFADRMNMMDSFSLGDVILPEATRMYTVGNVMSYSSSSGVKLTDGLSSDASFADDEALDNYISGLTLDDSIYTSTILKDVTVGRLDNIYSKLCFLLSADSSKAYNDTTQIVGSKLKTGAINNVIGNDSITLSDGSSFDDFQKISGNVTFSNSNPSKKSFWVVNGNVTINAGAIFNGFLIAAGNITIENGATVTGMLLSTGEKGSGNIAVNDNVTVRARLVTTGNINIGQNCNLSSDNTYIEGIFTEEGTLLNSFFKNSELTISFTTVGSVPSLVDLSQMISYENWRRLE